MTELEDPRVIDVLLVEDDDGDVLMTREAFEDIVRSYSLHANAFISKPVDFEHFIDAIRQIDTFFLTLVKLPV